jgi:membrane-associated phospholipid phosphatase
MAICWPVIAQTAASTGAAPAAQRDGLGADIKAYITAPARWEGQDWWVFGATLGTIGIAYQYDNRARDHFVTADDPSTAATDRHDVEDALPGMLALGGTWLAARVLNNRDGLTEAQAMLEAAVFSTTTSYVLKEAIGRQRPYAEAGRSSWSDGGDSFPSAHAAAAFAIGTVLAESGGDRYRWIRRVLGYGIGLGTAYARVEHDAHWLSDTVAGAGIGIATARFVLERDRGRARRGQTLLLPTDGGVVFAYVMPLRH